MTGEDILAGLKLNFTYPQSIDKHLSELELKERQLTKLMSTLKTSETPETQTVTPNRRSEQG